MGALKIRRDDEVVVISGKDRGKTGKVMRVDPAKQRVYVEGLNLVKRHQRPQQVRDAQRAESVGGVIEKEGPIHISNVMLIDPRDKKPTRVGVSRERGYEFLDRLMSIAIPRIRDFRGLKPNAFDGRGNYSMGVREQVIFPEIDYDSVDQIRGLDITITTSAKSDAEAFALLEALGMPFAREGRPDIPTATEEA